MFKTLLFKFKNERKGAPIVEYVILLCMTAVMAAMFIPGLNDAIKDTFIKLAKNNNEDSAEETGGSLPDYDNIIGISLNMTPSDNITPNTPVKFTASVKGGTAPYNYNWSNYNGSFDGSASPEQFYPSGEHTVSVRVTDSDGNAQFVSETFTVRSVPANLRLSDASPRVGTTITAFVESTEDISCRLLSPVTSTDCSYSFQIKDDQPFDVTVEVCQGTICENLKETVSPSYSPLQLNSISAERPNPMYNTDFAQFKANVQGGSGDYRVEWTNYNGPTEANVFGNQQQYEVGEHVVQARVCDNKTSECTELVGNSFEVVSEVPENMPLITWLNNSEVGATPELMGPILFPSDIGCVKDGEEKSCTFGTITPSETYEWGMHDPTSADTKYSTPQNGGTEIYTYNVEICFEGECRDNEFTVYVHTDAY